MPARLQQFELKTTYSFDCIANVDQYNLPYDSNNSLMYQGLINPVYVDGVEVSFMVDRRPFFRAFPQDLTNTIIGTGDGATTTFSLSTANNTNAQGMPIARGHLDVLGNLTPGFYLTAFDSSNNIMTISDNGTFATSNKNQGNLIVNNYISGIGSSAGTVIYTTGAVSVTFPAPPASSQSIYAQYYAYSAGVPRIILFFDNVITLRPVPSRSFLIQFDAYLTPAAFLNNPSAQIKFGYMSEYIARGSARKILSDTGDIEQFMFYEPLFREQENLVIRRTDRQDSVQRTPTIFTEFQQQSTYNSNMGN